MSAVAVYGAVDSYTAAAVLDRNSAGQICNKTGGIFICGIDCANRAEIFDSTAVKWSLVQHPSSYSQKAEVTQIDGLELDEIYEAKCIPFMRDGDMLWIVGKKL